jgi:hypothetical protein
LSIVAIDKYDETGDGKSSGNLYVEDTSADPALPGADDLSPVVQPAGFSGPRATSSTSSAVTYQSSAHLHVQVPYRRTFLEPAGADLRFDNNLRARRR